MSRRRRHPPLPVSSASTSPLLSSPARCRSRARRERGHRRRRLVPHIGGRGAEDGWRPPARELDGQAAVARGPRPRARVPAPTRCAARARARRPGRGGQRRSATGAGLATRWSRYPSSPATSRVRSVSTANREIRFIHRCFMPWWVMISTEDSFVVLSCAVAEDVAVTMVLHTSSRTSDSRQRYS